MILMNHVALYVSDFARCRSFYRACLTPLGIELIVDRPNLVGFGRNGTPEFWFSQEPDALTRDAHIAFQASSRSSVDLFYQAALGNGGTDNGAPKIWEENDPHYYAAYILDLDGNNIEAVCMENE